MNLAQNPPPRLENSTDSSQPADSARPAPVLWVSWFPLFSVAVAAVGLRVAAARGDLVLDEIWSWRIAQGCDSIWQIFFNAVDNNHILNTLALYGIDQHAPLWAFRLPAVLAGSLALWFAFRLVRRRGTAAVLCVLVLLGFSHLLILFGSEARGYGDLACCTLAAWWALDRYFDRAQLRDALMFGVASSLGVLSHPTFLFGWLAFGIYSLMKAGMRRYQWQRLVVLNALPVMTCVVLLFTYFSGMGIGGGEPTTIADVLLATLSLMAGGPERGAAAYFAAGVMATLIAAALAAEFRSDPARGCLFLTAIVAAPAVVLAVTGHAVLYPRYFLGPMIFAYVAVGLELSRWFRSGRIGSFLVTALLIGYVGCNLAPVVTLIREGRAQYSIAVRWIAEHTDGSVVSVASDHDFRNAWVIDFYAVRDTQAYAARSKALEYASSDGYAAEQRKLGTEWYLRHTFSGDGAPADSFTDLSGNKYELVKVFPAGSISGWTWWLYQRQRP